MPDAQGVYGKYVISKSDGSPVDPEACYFVLRLDVDPAARAAMLVYAEAVRPENEEMAGDIEACIEELETPPCNCREAICPHTRTFSSVWRHGGDEASADANQA